MPDRWRRSGRGSASVRCCTWVRGELKAGGFRRESILADATEALFGALYLEAGLAEARTLILRLLAGRLDSLHPEAELKDSKTRLQELLQGRGESLPEYILESAVGEPQ